VLIVVETTFLPLTVTVRGCQLIRLSATGLLTDTIPNTVDDLLVVQTLEDTVAPNQEKVKVVLQFE
jgi:hypothetical protein